MVIAQNNPVPDELSESLPIGLSFIERLPDTPLIIPHSPPMEHEFDAALFEHCSSLRPIHQNRQQLFRRDIEDLDVGVNWVVVARGVLISDQGPGSPVVQDALLRFKAVGVGVEGFVVCEVADQVQDDLLALLIVDRNAVNIRMQLKSVVEIVQPMEIQARVGFITFKNNNQS